MYNMKKYNLLFIALIGLMFWACKEESYSPSLPLYEPLNNENIDMASAIDVSFSWIHIKGISEYELLLSASENMDAPQTFPATGYTLVVTAAQFDEKLDALNIPTTATTKIYWSVRPSNGTEFNSEVRALNVNRPAPTMLFAPELGTTVALSYDNRTENALTFEWANKEGASSYELVFSKDANFSNTKSVTGISGTNKTLTNQELQDLLIEPDVFGLKRYKANDVFWNVKVAGQTGYISEVVGRIGLLGMPIFIDKRNNDQEVNVYKVAVIEYGDYEAVWMAEDLRTKYSADGTDLTTVLDPVNTGWSVRRRQFADVGLAMHDAQYWDDPMVKKTVPDYFTTIGTMYYRSYPNSATYINKGDWKLPTKAQICGLFDAALTYSENGAGAEGIVVLKDPARYADFKGVPCYTAWEWRPAKADWNKWKMNMGPNGHYAWGSLFYYYYNRDNAAIANHIRYLFDYSNETDKTEGQHIFHQEWIYPTGKIYGFPNPASDGFNTGLYPVRLIYTGR
jgi:hypothetical protein